VVRTIIVTMTGQTVRYLRESHKTARLDYAVNAQTLANFKIGVMARHGSTYRHMSEEITRALALHTELLVREAQQLSPKQKAKVAAQIIPDKSGGAVYAGRDEGSDSDDGLAPY